MQLGVVVCAVIVGAATGCSPGAPAPSNSMSLATATASSPTSTTPTAAPTASAATTALGPAAGDAPASAVSTGASPAAGAATLILGGRRQDLTNVVCTDTGSAFLIAVGPDKANMGVQFASASSLQVQQVGLGLVDGVLFGVGEGYPGGAATATKNAATYTIAGTATSLAVPTAAPQSTPFTLTATCPPS